jgi:PKD repeat protein
MYNCWDLFGVRHKGHHITFVNCYAEGGGDKNYDRGFYFRTGAHDILVKNCRANNIMHGMNTEYDDGYPEWGMTRDVTFENCIADGCIYGLIASGQDIKYINCISAGSEDIGGLFAVDGLMLKNSIIYNSANAGIVVQHAPIQDEITYCNVWGNSPNYSSPGGGASPGTGCKSEDPLFADPANGDFHLKKDSPCIDAGDPSSAYTHEPAPNGGRINMGAYGNTGEATTSGPSGPDTISPYTSGYNPAKNATGVSKDTCITVHIKDDGDGVDKSSIEMTVEGVGVTPTITGNKNDYTLTYTTSFNYSQVVNVIIKAEDLASPANIMPPVNYAFTIESAPPAPDTTAPAAVTDLSASDPSSHSITLTWPAPGDDVDTGTASLYDIRYSTTEISEANWNAATQCTGEPTPQVAGSTETFTVTGLAPNTTYYFDLKTADEVPNWASISNVANGRTTEAVGDLAGYWKFDEDSATTAIDATGNGNDGTIYGASRIDGKLGLGTALEFDGTDDYIDCGNDASLNITGDAITILMWLKPASTYPPADNCGIISKNGWNNYAVLQKDYGPLKWMTKTSSGYKEISSATTPTAGVWTHIAATYDGSMMKIYFYGEKAGEIAQSGTIVDSAEDHLFIAKRDGDRWGGAIDEVKIYNRALSAEEIRADYEANGTNLPPVADPNNPYIGMEGVPIHFKGNGSYDPDGSIVAYEWDFGDGNTSSEVNPTHIYAQDGTYNITLTVTDNEGATNTKITTATIADIEPTVEFSATHTSGKKPLTVAFTDNSTSYDGIMTWEWDFDNDGVTDSTVQNPKYEYAEEGVYTVSLGVNESDGDSDSMTKVDYITVTKANEAPFTPTNPSPFDGATDVPVDADLSWTGGDPDAGDTETYDVYFGTSTSPLLVAENHTGTTYDQGMQDYSTEYYWQVVTTDNHGAFNESEVWSFVTASGSDLAAEWHLDDGNGTTAVDTSGNGNDGTLVNNPAWVKGKIGKALLFDGTNDYVHCGQGSSLKITGAITVEAWVNWTGAGNPYFVTKSGGPGQRSYDLSGNEDGTVEFRVGGADCNTMKSSGTIAIPAGEWVHLAGTYEPSSYVRLFVDGALAKENIVSIPASQGDNGLSWYIGAREGNQGWFNGTIDKVKIYNRALSAEEVRAEYEAGSTNQPPVADPNGPYTGMEVVPILFNGSGSYDYDGSIVAYEWDFGDGSNATGATPTHTYAQNGTYNVTLTVTDNEGATNTSTTTADIESDLIPPYTTGYSPAKDAIEVAKNTTIVVHVKDDGAGVDITSIVMTVNGITVTPIITGTPADYTLTYVPSVDFECGQIVYVTVDAHDLATAP